MAVDDAGGRREQSFACAQLRLQRRDAGAAQLLEIADAIGSGMGADRLQALGLRAVFTMLQARYSDA